MMTFFLRKVHFPKIENKNILKAKEVIDKNVKINAHLRSR